MWRVAIGIPGWAVWSNLDLNLRRCRGLQTPDERVEAFRADFKAWRAVAFASSPLHELGSQLATNPLLGAGLKPAILKVTNRPDAKRLSHRTGRLTLFATPHALCATPHALCATLHAPRPTFHAPRPTFHAPCPTLHAPRSTFHAPCPTLHAPRPTFHAPRPTFHAPRPTFYAPRPTLHAPRPMLHAPRPTLHAPRAVAERFRDYLKEAKKARYALYAM